MSNGLTESPVSGQWFHYLVLNHLDTYVTQIAVQFNSDSFPVFIRVMRSGTWSVWRNFNPGTATTAQVLSGYTFSSTSGSNLTGTMTNRGTLNWSGSNTTYTVPAGYYSGGTLDSRTSYTNGYNSAKSSYQLKSISGWVTSSNSTYGFKQCDDSVSNKYYITVDMNYTHNIVCAFVYTSTYANKHYHMTTKNGYTMKMYEPYVYDMTKTHPSWNTDRYFYVPVGGNGWSYHYDIWYV